MRHVIIIHLMQLIIVLIDSDFSLIEVCVTYRIWIFACYLKSTCMLVLYVNVCILSYWHVFYSYLTFEVLTYFNYHLEISYMSYNFVSPQVNNQQTME
jgi:hypothetical protein